MSQKTIAQLKTDSNNTYTDNTSGDIAPSGVRTLNTDWLDSVKPLEVIVSANKTAILGESYVVIASATFTDPTPVEGKGYTVFVRNGTATVGGVAYDQAGTIINRIFHSGAWKNHPINLSGSWEPIFTGWEDTGWVEIATFNVVGGYVNFMIWFGGTPAEPGSLTISVPANAPMDTTLVTHSCSGSWSSRFNSIHGLLDGFVDSDGSGNIRFNIETITTPGPVEITISGQYKLA